MPVTVMAQETNSMVVNLEASYGQTEARTMLDMLNKWRTGSDAWEYAPDGSIIRYNTSAENTLQPLVYDYALEQIAMQRAAEIALNFSHTRPNGTSCNTVIYEEFAANGENIAIGSAGSQNDNVAGILNHGRKQMRIIQVRGIEEICLIYVMNHLELDML